MIGFPPSMSLCCPLVGFNTHNALQMPMALTHILHIHSLVQLYDSDLNPDKSSSLGGSYSVVVPV